MRPFFYGTVTENDYTASIVAGSLLFRSVPATVPFGAFSTPPKGKRRLSRRFLRYLLCFSKHIQERRRMSYTRRRFLKMAGMGALCLTLSQFGFNLEEAQAYAGSLKIEGAKEVITICPFCAVCCQVIAYVRDGKLVSTEGDPDFPVNEGSPRARRCSLCIPIRTASPSRFTALPTVKNGRKRIGAG